MLIAGEQALPIGSGVGSGSNVAGMIIGFISAKKLDVRFVVWKLPPTLHSAFGTFLFSTITSKRVFVYEMLGNGI